MNVFRQLLGDAAYDGLPEAVRDFHDHAYVHYIGTAFSGGAATPLAGVIRKIFGFPARAESMPVSVELDMHDGRDRWRRDFGGCRFSSSFLPNSDGTLDESFPPFRFRFRLRAETGRMYWDFTGWSLGGPPLPRIETWEAENGEGGFEFYSHADFPVLGRLVHYHGVVFPKGQEAEADGCGSALRGEQPQIMNIRTRTDYSLSAAERSLRAPVDDMSPAWITARPIGVGIEMR